MLDIYQEIEYCKLYQEIESGICESFFLESKYGYVNNVFIKRPIPWLLNGKQYYDIVTPYGYGGPVMIEPTKNDKIDTTYLIDKYSVMFSEYCLNNNIISEFVRFHPLLKNANDWKAFYDVTFNRNTLAVDLTDSDYSMTQLNSNCRNMIRKAIKKGVVVEFDNGFSTINEFCELYYATMKKNSATDYYYFPEEYFAKLKKSLNDQVVLINARVDNVLVSSSIFLLSKKYMHYHLSANNSEYNSFAANNLLLAMAIEFGQTKGLQWLHLGGGLSADQNDSLFIFKRSFARMEKNLKQFYIGKKIYDENIYNQLVIRASSEKTLNENFFPMYRG